MELGSQVRRGVDALGKVRTMRYVACLLLTVLLAGLSLGATISLEGDGGAYYVALSDPNAECLIGESGDTGVKEARCAAGAYLVTATIEWGCGDSFGPTYCGSVNPGNSAIVANELRCGQGTAYVLVGGRGEVRCEGDEDAKRCQSLEGDDFAEATCTNGCGVVRGAGVCCIAASTSCPPGIDVVEE